MMLEKEGLVFEQKRAEESHTDSPSLKRSLQWSRLFYSLPRDSVGDQKRCFSLRHCSAELPAVTIAKKATIELASDTWLFLDFDYPSSSPFRVLLRI